MPANFPSWTVTGQAAWEGYLATTTLGIDPFAVVLDEQGHVVWYHPAAPEYTDIRLRFRQDKGGVLFAQHILGNPDDPPVFDWLDWDGTTSHEDKIPGYTHDFIELSDGTLAFIQNDIRPFEPYEQEVWGNNLVERDDLGNERIVWSTWDDWTPGIDGDVLDDGVWTHDNALDLNAEETVYTLGSRDTSTIVQVDRVGSQRIWQLGGFQNNFPQTSVDDLPVHQHQFEWDGDRLVVFDNGRNAQTGSRLLELSFDEAAQTATSTCNWQRDPATWAYVMGDVKRQVDGGLLAAFGTAGVLDDISADGTVRWELATPLGTAIGYLDWAESLPGVTRIRSSE